MTPQKAWVACNDSMKRNTHGLINKGRPLGASKSMVEVPRNTVLVKEDGATIAIVGDGLFSSTWLARYNKNIPIENGQLSSFLALIPEFRDHANSTTTLCPEPNKTRTNFKGGDSVQVSNLEWTPQSGFWGKTKIFNVDPSLDFGNSRIGVRVE